MQEKSWQEPDADMSAWLFGIGAPATLAILSLCCWFTQTAIIPSRRHYDPIVFHGLAAVIIGVFLFFMGSYLHFHFWWNARRDTSSETATEWGEAVSLIGLVLSGLYVAWSFISLFWQ